jgi:hypothetical protein
MTILSVLLKNSYKRVLKHTERKDMIFKVRIHLVY